MFDTDTAKLIRAAPEITGVDPQLLPQELTRIYAELVTLRLRSSSLEAVPERTVILERLGRIAAIYEAIVDTNGPGEGRKAAAFVSGTAHQILGQLLSGPYSADFPFLSASAIHPRLAAPLLFLIAGQNADAREASKALIGARTENVLKSAAVETIHDLAAEHYEAIFERAHRLSQLRAPIESNPEIAIEQALYGLCWTGIVHLAAVLLGLPKPQSAFLEFESPQAAFDQVVKLAVGVKSLDPFSGPFNSIFAGPRHLARLLRHVADSLIGSGLVMVKPPSGVDETFWKNWLSFRAKSKPVLWKNHQSAIATKFLEPGRSAVLVLPTGAGKTTLSELKIASALGNGKKVIFLVPTLALVDQLRDELASNFPKNIGDVTVASDGDLTAALTSIHLQSIEVMTPERCLALMNHAPDALDGVGLIVFDECHLLSPQGGGTRSLDAMLCLIHAMKKAPEADFLLLSAMLTNAPELAGWLEAVTGRRCTAFEDLWKPSRQARGVVIYPKAELDGIALSSAIPKATPYALFGLSQNWLAKEATDTSLIKLSDSAVTLARAADTPRRITPNANSVAAELAALASGAGLKTIVFVQQADHAPSTASKIGKLLGTKGVLTESEIALWKDVQTELGGAQYSIIDPTAESLPHNGDMLPLERRLAEARFRRDGGATVIVATPTLAQGMNLPAQLAILAGDKRHDADGRSSLEAHEILNAAGRAGRAGHLSNGVVLMIPEPVTRFSTGLVAEDNAFDKLRTLLPSNDRCVSVEDPITHLLDLIQAGWTTDPQVQYFISQIHSSDTGALDTAAIVAGISNSFGMFQARQRKTEEDFNAKVAALKSFLDAGGETVDATNVVAAVNGLPVEPLKAIASRLRVSFPALPVSIVGWSDWLVGFFATDAASFQSLLGNSAETAIYVMRGMKAGGPPNTAEFMRLREGLRLWLAGRPFNEIETALGASEDKLKCCPRTRDLVLKLANRGLYVLMGALSDLVKGLYTESGLAIPEAAVLDVLAVAMRKGYDSPGKVAFGEFNTEVRSRVEMHRMFAAEFTTPPSLSGLPYEQVRAEITLQIVLKTFGNF